MPGIDRRGELKYWFNDPSYAARSQQRYLVQTRYTDTLIGDFIQKLEVLGIYDEALIVVVADHGVNHRPGFPRRAAITSGHSALPTNDTEQETGYNSAMDILKVPTFIKLPKQRLGKIIDTPFDGVDILPTILAALEIESSLSFDGVDARNTDIAPRTSHKFYSKYNQGFIEHDMNILSKSYDYRRKFRILDTQNNFAIRSEHYEGLIGKSVDDQVLSTKTIGHTRFDTPERYENLDLRDDFVPVLIEGYIDFLEAKTKPTHVTVAINGIIRSIDTLYVDEDGPNRFSLLVDENDFRSGENEVRVYLVDAMNNAEAPLVLLPALSNE